MKIKLILSSLALVLLLSVGLQGGGARASAAPATPVRVIQVDGAVYSHPAFFDKTRFLLHMGVAFYAFHHFVYKRYQDGGFASGASGRTGNFIKAGIALLFAVHELKVAYGIANSSNSSILKALVAPINALTGKASQVATKLKGGNYDPKDITDINSSVDSISSQAKSGGYTIKDTPVPVPGAA